MLVDFKFLPPAGSAQFELPNARLLCDMRYFPIWTFRTNGRIDYDLVRLIYTVRDPLCYWAAAHGTKLWAIWEFGPDTTTPDAINRKAIAELGEAADEIEGFFNVCILVQNPLLRGVVTAVKWIMGDRARVDLASDFSTAIQLGRRRYEAAGLAIPKVPDDYQMPEGKPTIHAKLTVEDLSWSLSSRGKDVVEQRLRESR